MRPAILLAIGAVAAGGGAVAGTTFAPAETLREITLQRTACYGTCPVYTLTLRADGTATYRGEAHVERIGRFEGTVSARDIQRLGQTLASLKPETWKRDYVTGATDQASQILTIVTSRGRRTIREYGASGPTGLWTAQTLVDGIGARARNWSAATE